MNTPIWSTLSAHAQPQVGKLHLHVLSTCGSVKTEGPIICLLGPLLIVVEFAEHGNLLRHLRDHRKENYEDMNEYSLEISSAERLRIASDVSSGMKHLAAMKVCKHQATTVIEKKTLPLGNVITHNKKCKEFV